MFVVIYASLSAICMQDKSRSYKRIVMNFWRRSFGRGSRSNWVDFGCNPDFFLDFGLSKIIYH